MNPVTESAQPAYGESDGSHVHPVPVRPARRRDVCGHGGHGESQWREQADLTKRTNGHRSERQPARIAELEDVVYDDAEVGRLHRVGHKDEILTE